MIGVVELRRAVGGDEDAPLDQASVQQVRPIFRAQPDGVGAGLAKFDHGGLRPSVGQRYPDRPSASGRPSLHPSIAD